MKKMIIAGCSHAAGSEIDGSEDSTYNRQNSFGNILAKKMSYTPINIASPSATNHTIARSVLEWFSTQYDPADEVFVVVAWTESSRMEVPMHRATWYDHHTPHHDWFSTSGRDYIRINSGYPGGTDDERAMIPDYHRFMVNNEIYLQIASANAVLQMQYFLNMHKVGFVMSNTMHMFKPMDHHLKFYIDQIDKTTYMGLYESFFWKFRNAGYINEKAKYWHHNEIPHQIYADELYSFIHHGNIL